MRSLRLLLVFAAAFFAGPAHAGADLSLEAPILKEEVASRRLPPVEKRLPSEPRVINVAELGGQPGKNGGTLRFLMGDARDIRMASLYGYTRLVVFDTKGNLVPDILLSADVQEGRIFTFKLRPGHRWSDGQPFTAEDFRYWWEDVANNERLNPDGPPAQMLVAGEKPTFEVVDETTVRFTWNAPNPSFLPSLAAAQPAQIMMPAHYMKQFHKKYADPNRLASLVAQEHVKDWGALHDRKSRWYRPENPELPTLSPWRPRTTPPAELFVFERNPYFHRVDENGRQLPYIDTMTMSIGSSSLVPAKVGSGAADLAARYIRFEDYTFLKAGEQRNDYSVRLWERGEGSYASLVPNLNVSDPVWRALFRDVRVRRALSVGFDRHTVNQVIFFGLAHEGANTVLPDSPLYDPKLDQAWAKYDPDLANKLLDEAGLNRRDDDGIRLLPDGRRAEITIETAGDSTEESDILELVGYDWQKIGIKLFVRATQRDVLRRRVIGGNVMMSVWPGMDNATPAPDMDPSALAPMDSMQFQWPLWGQYQSTMGREGEKPDMPAAVELITLKNDWSHSTTTEERRRIWSRMLEINAEEVFSIGVVNRVKQPVVVSNRLRNVPIEGVYGFEPGAYFGIYMPDTFWFDDVAKAN
jgi:peptide/nickel transport system substrate-binding protein